MMDIVRFLLMHWRGAADRRLGTALLASTLLHALLLFSLSAVSVHGHVFTRPVYAPLSVQIEKLPESQQATSIAIDKKKSSLHQKRSAAKRLISTVPANIEPSLPQPGVSISPTLYLKPIGGRAGSALLASGEFLRASDVSEKPEIVRMRVPQFPQPAREQNLSGWVIVMLLVDEQGKVVETAAVDASETFNDYEKSIADELRDSTFMPGKLDGRAVKTLMFAAVRFDSRGLPGPENPARTTASAPIESGEKR